MSLALQQWDGTLGFGVKAVTCLIELDMQQTFRVRGGSSSSMSVDAKRKVQQAEELNGGIQECTTLAPCTRILRGGEINASRQQRLGSMERYRIRIPAFIIDGWAQSKIRHRLRDSERVGKTDWMDLDELKAK
ncbi:hypothetical protein B0H13DRAFT_1910030 [Mycena leptocephala]|nr:hypothetical protein B0H13DRAFT_1910030 [Mycena leptocephala]